MDLVAYNISLNIAHVGRLRLDAGLYDEPGEQPAKMRGKKPKKGLRQPNLKTRLSDPGTTWRTLEMTWNGGQNKTVQIASDIALWYVKGHDPVEVRWVLVRRLDEQGKQIGSAAAVFSTEADMTAEEIVALYAERWNIEIFFEEVRACLGFETQRGWSNSTIGRTTPCLFGIFSLVVILAKRLYPEKLPIRQSAWYVKEEATFRDVLGAVRHHLWSSTSQAGQQREINSGRSCSDHDWRLIPANLFDAIGELACYAA